MEPFLRMVRLVCGYMYNTYCSTSYSDRHAGAGKTYTVSGPSEISENRGLCSRTMDYLFQCARAASEEIVSIKFSAIEIYNDIASDLLRPQASKIIPKLLIVDSPTGIMVPELFLVPISNADEGFEKLIQANSSRFGPSC